MKISSVPMIQVVFQDDLVAWNPHGSETNLTSLMAYFNTLRPIQYNQHFVDEISIFFWNEIFIFWFLWRLSPKVYLTISQYWPCNGLVYYLCQWWRSLLTHICLIRFQRINKKNVSFLCLFNLTYGSYKPRKFVKDSSEMWFENKTNLSTSAFYFQRFPQGHKSSPYIHASQ